MLGAGIKLLACVARVRSACVSAAQVPRSKALPADDVDESRRARC